MRVWGRSRTERHSPFYVLDAPKRRVHDTLLVVTDEEIESLLRDPKVPVGRIPSKFREKGAHREVDVLLKGISGNDYTLLLRQSRELYHDFSCGLRLTRRGAEDFILLRLNGNSHAHINHIEKQRFCGRFHVHRATARYFLRGKAEHYAEVTEQYENLDGALAHMLDLAAITGIPSSLRIPFP